MILSWSLVDLYTSPAISPFSKACYRREAERVAWVMSTKTSLSLRARGYMDKMGGFITSWRRRYFQLDPTGALNYYGTTKLRIV
eukprot:1391646-Amorphochlora_amoeboformis.AAC.2